jgi:hypothetical protein
LAGSLHWQSSPSRLAGQPKKERNERKNPDFLYSLHLQLDKMAAFAVLPMM